MDIDEIKRLLMVGSIKPVRIEHNFSDNELIITYREPSNALLLCDPPKPAPGTFYRVTYGVEGCDLCVLNIQVGHENITPERREIIYD